MIIALQDLASFLAVIFIVALMLFVMEWMGFGFVYSYYYFKESLDKLGIKKVKKEEIKNTPTKKGVKEQLDEAFGWEDK